MPSLNIKVSILLRVACSNRHVKRKSHFNLSLLKHRIWNVWLHATDNNNEEKEEDTIFAVNRNVKEDALFEAC